MTYLICSISAVFISLVVFILMKLAYSKYSNSKSLNLLTGFDVARKILDENGLDKMYIVEVKGDFSDHYDPNQKVIRLSSNIYNGNNLISTAIACMICMQAVTTKGNDELLKIRYNLSKIVNFLYIASILIFFVEYSMHNIDLYTVSFYSMMICIVFYIFSLVLDIQSFKGCYNELERLSLIADNDREKVKYILGVLKYRLLALIFVIDL